MTAEPYVVSEDNPPPPEKDMLYWERFVELSVSVGKRSVQDLVEQLSKSLAANKPASSVGGWKLRLANSDDSYRVMDGERYSVQGPLEYARRQSIDGALIAVPVPKTFAQARMRAGHLGDVVICEPNVESLLSACAEGDALYVMMPSKLWPDFEESPLAAAVYNANTSFASLIKGYMGELHGTPVWSELYETPSNHLLDGHLVVVKRDADKPKQHYRIDAMNPPEPNSMVLYWESNKEEGVPGWLSIDENGEALAFVAYGSEEYYYGERAEYQFYADYTRIAIAKPRSVTEAYRYSVLRGGKTVRPSILKFCHECNRTDAHYVIIGSDLMSKLLLNKRIMQDPEFCLSTEYERTLNGFLGTYKGTEVWTDAFMPSEERMCNNRLIACWEKP